VSRLDCDVVVVGAGPAGCVAAHLLASWGHQVILVGHPGARRSLAESVPPSARKTLHAGGMLTAVERAGFHPWRGNTVWWADGNPRIEAFAEGEEGYQVQRGELDRVLRDGAVEAGAHLVGGLARDVTCPAVWNDDSRPTVTVETGSSVTRLTARYVLDCTGRAGLVARRGLRRSDATRTIALVGRWRSPNGWRIPDNSHTLVASYADGWAWSIPTGPVVRDFTVMVDPNRTSLARDAPSIDVYRAEVGKVGPFAPILVDATLEDGPWGADASGYDASRYSGPGFLLVGDAASFIDPLSSFGVKKALASAWVAAVVMHTSINRPAMNDEALRFHDRRERAVVRSYRVQAAQFAAAAAAENPHPFWNARAASAEDLDVDDGADVDPRTLARDPQVLAAFEELRRSPELRLQPGSGFRLVPRPVIRGREIVMDDHLSLPHAPDGIRYIRGVDLLAVTRLAPQHTDAGAMFDAYQRNQPNVILPDFLGALSLLVASGALQNVRTVER
jgi:flavin-dependent dehydrogenase